MYMLDTNMVIIAIRHPNRSAAEKVYTHMGLDLCISAVVYAELQYGIFKSQKPEEGRDALAKILRFIPVLPFNKPAAEHFGDIFADLERKKCRIGDRDTMIAAHARSLGYTVVTHNVREFSRVAELSYEDWV